MSDVQIYVYDLSHGMAKSMSLMLTGKQIDGIWHTSTVFDNTEFFFGQGILECLPGTSHLGRPLQIIDVGTTHLDGSTFREYLDSLAEVYRAEDYHLIEKNCNHFTADLVGYLTGAKIPEWISGLPTEFLSTPFGQAMKPQIDAMFRRTAPTEHQIHPHHGAGPSTLPTPPLSGSSTPAPPIGSSLLNAVASQATATPTTPPSPPAPTPPTSPLTLVSSSTNFASILKQYLALVVNFTNTPGCPPCRAIKPVYEAIAAEHSATYGPKGARFVEVELGVGEGRDIAGQYKVTATPTFMFFREGKKVDELRGAGKKELEAKVEAFLDETWPRHPHRKAYLPLVEGLPTKPILLITIPNYPALLTKLEGFGAEAEGINLLRNKVVPMLEGQSTLPESQLKDIARRWTGVVENMVVKLEPAETFPLIDLWRVALIQPRFSALLAVTLSPSAPTDSENDPISPLLSVVTKELKANGPSTSKPLLLTALRLLTNLLSPLPLANLLLPSPCPSDRITSLQADLMAITVESLLHAESGVRSAAARVAFNIAGWRHRNAKQVGRGPEDGEEAEWELELVSALVEGLGREEDEDVAHRLLAPLSLMLYLAPGYVESMQPLLEVLGAKSIIQGKMKAWKLKDVRKIAEEVIGKLL